MIKKLLCLLLMVCLLMSPFMVNAKTTVTGNVSSSGEITVSIGTDKLNDEYFVYILKPDVTVSDINSVTETDKIAGVANIKIDNENAKSAKIKLPSGSKYGVYTAIIGGGELYGKNLKLAYSASNDAANLAAAATSISALESVLTNPSYKDVAWCLDFTKPAYINNKQTVLANMITLLDEQTSVTNQSVVLAYDQAVALAEIKTCAQNEIAKNILLNKEVLKKDYSQIINKDKSGFEKSFKDLRNDTEFSASDITNLSDLDKMVKAAEALLEVNNADREEIIDTLKTYNNIFELDFTGKFEEVDSYDLAKALADSTKEYKGVTDVKSYFKSSIEKLIETEPVLNVGTSSGGGGKGGSSKVSGFSTGVVTDYSTLVPDNSKNENLSDLNDVEWAVPYIKYLNDNAIMLGDGNGKFRPNDNIKREEILKLIVEGLKLASDEEISVSFGDVNEGDWFKKYVALGAHLEVVKGVSDVLFGVGTNVTREDAAVMMYRALNVKGYAFGEDKEAEFTDKEDFSGYSFEAVSKLYNAKVISGYDTGDFKPKNLLTRAEAAKLIYSIIKIME